MSAYRLGPRRSYRIRSFDARGNANGSCEVIGRPVSIPAFAPLEFFIFSRGMWQLCDPHTGLSYTHGKTIAAAIEALGVGDEACAQCLRLHESGVRAYAESLNPSARPLA
jgi:hypothetical protein